MGRKEPQPPPNRAERCELGMVKPPPPPAPPPMRHYIRINDREIDTLMAIRRVSGEITEASRRTDVLMRRGE